LLLLLTLCPTVHWLDGGSLTAAAHLLVSAHPPGEPVYSLLGRALMLLPLGAIPFRAALVSALCLLPGLLLSLRIFQRLLQHAQLPSSAAWLSGLFCLGCVLTYPLWIQGVRAEVYSLQWFLALLTLWYALDAGLLDNRLHAGPALKSAFALGLNLAVHPLLAGLMAIPPALLGLRLLKSLPTRLIPLLIAALGLGFSTYLLLPLRAMAQPGLGWGDPSRLNPLLDVMLARTFQHNFSPLTPALLLHNASILGNSLLAAAGPGVLLLALLGMAVLLVRRLHAVVLLLGLILTNLWSILPQNKVFADNPDLHGYLMLSHTVLWWLAAFAVVWLQHRLDARSRLLARLTPLLALMLAAPAVIFSWKDVDRSRDDLARRHGLAALRNLTPGASLQVSGNNTTFILLYLQEVERLRPDVTVLSRTLLTHDWYRKRTGHDEAWARAAAGSVASFLETAQPTATRVELRERDLVDAPPLCPAPAPGWGFYDVGPCRDRRSSTPFPPGGLLTLPGVDDGPEARSVGLNAQLYLIDLLRLRQQPQAAASLEVQLKARYPELELAHRQEASDE
jgi:hypothetical protein